MPRDVRTALRAQEVDYFEALQIFLSPPYQQGSINLVNTDSVVTVAGIPHAPFRWSMDPAAASIGSEADRTTIRIEDPKGLLPRIHQRYRLSRADVQVNFLVRGMSTDDSDIIPIFRGRTGGPTFSESAFEVPVTSVFSLASQVPAPRKTFGPHCPHMLGDDDCGVDRDSPGLFYQAIAATDSDNGTIVDAGLTQSADFWTPGSVLVMEGFNAGLPPADVRSYTPANTTTGQPGRLELMWDYPFSLAGSTFRVRRECPKTIRGCVDIFNNGRRFGGVPQTPRPTVLSGQSSSGLGTR